MASTLQRRPFSAERQRALQQGDIGEERGHLSAEVAGSIEALRRQIDGLQDKLDDLSRDLKAAAEPPTPPAEEAAETAEESDEALFLRIEIARMAKVLGQAKLEIAQIRHPMSDDDRVKAASSELDAIVLATETATNTILEASEEINQLCTGLVDLGSDDPVVTEVAGLITSQVIRVMEACNFQDITGQRITKVVTTLQVIEDRIKAIIDIIGKDAFTELPLPEQKDADDESHLLAGPQATGEGVSQADIDALFD